MRDISQLYPVLQTKIKELQSKCDKVGLKIGISECLRTVAEQDALYAKGRTTAGKIVTNAKGSTYSSMHQWGVAFDFYRNDGKGAYEDSDGFFTKVGKIGQSIGLEWGGNWKSIKDKPHFQLPDWGSTTAKLKQQYGTPERFFATWQQAEYGTETDPIKYRLVKNSYLWKSPGLVDNKVEYRTLTSTLKKKCDNVDGLARLKAGSTFTQVRGYVDDSGDWWAKIKSGYWIATVYKGQNRIENV